MGGDCRFLETATTHHRHDAGAQKPLVWSAFSTDNFPTATQNSAGAPNYGEESEMKGACIINSNEVNHHYLQQFDQCCASAESSSCSLPILLQQRCEVMLDVGGAHLDAASDVYENEMDEYGNNIRYNRTEMINDHKVCSMCGDVGIAKHLFKCVRCPHRFQHTYCSRSYPHNVVLICNWCLHLKELERKPTLSIIIKHPDNINTQTVHDDDQIVSEPAAHHDHSKAFEYLLQIAATTVSSSTGNQDTPTIRNITESKELPRPASNSRDTGAKKDTTSKCKVGSLSSCTLSRANCDHAADRMFEIMKGHLQKRQRCTKNLVEEQSRCHYKGHTSNNSCTQAALGSLNTRWKQVASKRSHNPLRNSSPTPSKAISNRRYKLLADVLC